MNQGSLRRANRPALDDSGYAKGKITSVESGIGVRKEKVGRDIEEIEYQKYTFQFSVEGVAGDLDIQIITGTVINDEPAHIIAKGRGVKKEKRIYNRLTNVCLSLGLVTEEELPTLNDKKIAEIEKELEKIKDLKVTFKIGRNIKTGFLNIDPQSIRIIASEKRTNETK